MNAASQQSSALFRLINVDRLHSCVFGGEPSEHDFAIVVNDAEQVPHPITGEPQPRQVFSGTLRQAHEFVRASSSDTGVNK